MARQAVLGRQVVSNHAGWGARTEHPPTGRQEERERFRHGVRFHGLAVILLPAAISLPIAMTVSRGDGRLPNEPIHVGSTTAICAGQTRHATRWSEPTGRV